MFLLHKRPESAAGIEIHGTLEFRSRVKESLALLSPLEQFDIVRKNLVIIRQARRSGMKAWLPKPTFNVGKATWSHSAVWFAGAIAHDAYHAKLYNDAKLQGQEEKFAHDSWTGTDAEKQCLKFQREVLAQLNADGKIIAYVEKCQENPTYQGRNQGWRSWLDYLRRRW